MRFSSLSLSVLVFCATVGAAHASEEKVIWNCRTSNPFASPILHLVEWGGQSYVKFSYMRFSAHFEADEEQRAWYWHNDGTGYYRYGLVLGSDGQAWYHRFSATDGGEPQPLDYFLCSTDEEE